MKRLFWLVAGTAFGISLLSAYCVEQFLDQRIALIGQTVGLQRSFNDGVAFGMDLGIWQPVLIGAAMVLVLWLALQASLLRMQAVAYGLIVGGGMANIVDRLLDGHVTDVFQVGSFPIFNVADSCITVGVLLLLVDMMQSQPLKQG